MKKRILLAAFVTLGLLAGCSNKPAETTVASSEAKSEAASSEAKEESKAAETTVAGELEKLKVGASPAPHAEILKEAKAALAKKGYDLEIVEYTDYVQPNNALEAKEIDANYFQHVPYLVDFNEKYGTKLVSAGTVHYEPFGIYAGKTKSLDDLKEGSKIAVPNDVTNEARALLLLEANGILKLKDGAGLDATKNDIVENPKKVEIIEVEAAQTPRSLQDVDVAVINGNFAIAAGLKVKDALATESAESEAAKTFANIIAVRDGDTEKESIKALMEVLQSDEIKKFIETKYDGAVVPIFF
jgi:D-methionine transport system permease protein